MGSVARVKPVYDAVVVGGGGAGIATVGALLHFHPSAQIRWVDPVFSAGRLGARYRDVSSNTRTALFRQYADAFAPFQRIVAEEKKRGVSNAMTRLEALEQGKGCRLTYAADVLQLLTAGLRKMPEVSSSEGVLENAAFSTDRGTWSARDAGKDAESRGTIEARNLILCTGSFPSTMALPTSRPRTLDLDDALDRPTLRRILTGSPSSPTIGVIGTSHSAIVAIMNLYELHQTASLPLKIKWFARSALLYAQDMPGGWILRDNTGLKGASAEFARQHLDSDAVLAASPVGAILTKVHCPDASDPAMAGELDACSHIVQAIGYTRSQTPEIAVDGAVVSQLDYDPAQGALRRGGSKDGETIPHAFGAGIAFPERTTDPLGNVESAVGLWKFVKYLNRVAKGWC